MFGFFKKKEKKKEPEVITLPEEAPVEETVDLNSASNADLPSLVFTPLSQRSEAFADVKDALATFNTAEKNVFLTYWYESQVLEGGLEFFLTEESRKIAPFVGDALGAIGAHDHKMLYTKFLYGNGLDPEKIAAHGDYSEAEAAKLSEDYPFIGFTDTFYEYPMIQDYLAVYIRAHLDELSAN